MRWKLEYILEKNGGGILFDDENVIVINKPAGLLVLPDRFNRQMVNLYKLLRETFGTIFVVHRIDKETSGVILFAKTAEMHTLLNTAFEQRQVEKFYRAIVVGSPNADSGRINLPIVENEYSVRMKIEKKNGKEAITDYKVIDKFNGYALLETMPHTGRTHQIRIHLSAIGLPILADPLYNNSGWFFLSSIKQNYKSQGEEKPLLARTALHAFAISFMNRVTGKKMIIEAPMPKDMEAVLKVLKKYRGR